MQLHCQKEEVNTYRVGDDEDVSVRRSVSSGLGEVADDGSVGVEEVCQLVSFMSVQSQPEREKIIPSRVMPGLRGTPAGMRTTSEPLRASLRPDSEGLWPETTLLVLMWLRSAATPIGIVY